MIYRFDYSVKFFSPHKNWGVSPEYMKKYGVMYSAITFAYLCGQANFKN